MEKIREGKVTTDTEVNTADYKRVLHTQLYDSKMDNMEEMDNSLEKYNLKTEPERNRNIK